MGQATTCSATFKGRRSEGRAELETDYVLFRGDFRVKLPLQAVTEVSARDGVLSIASGDGTLQLTLGPAAEKWAAKISSPKSRLAKIGVKEGHRVSVLGIGDSALVSELKNAGADVSMRARKDSDIVFLGIDGASDLARIAGTVASLRQDGALWVIRRKGLTDASEAQTMAAGKTAGLVDVKVVRFSETHTAEKFVIPKARRKK
jgi:hypothetical protein